MKRYRRRLKKTTKQYIIVCIISLVVTATSAAAITLRIINNVKTTSNKKIEEYKTEMENNKREVYISLQKINKGEAITEELVQRKYVYATQPQETYITAEDIGKKALIDITEGTQILKTMLTDNIIEDDLREVEFNSIMITSNISDNDFVDIRIAFPNGEDFTILSKKNIKGYDPGTLRCLLWINEEELLRMQSAIVDAYLYEGSYIYTTKYIEPNLQDPLITNYEPKIEVINLIRKNPNIVKTAANKLNIQARKALENRLSNSFEKDIKEKWDDIENDYIYSSNDEIEEYTEVINENVISDSNIPDEKNIIDEETENSEKTERSESIYDEHYFPELGKA